MPLQSFAQTKADSLWGVWEDTSQADTNRLDALHLYIWEVHLFYNPDSAYYLAQVLYDYAEERENKIFMGRANTTKGVSFAIVNEVDSAIVYYQKAMSIFNDIGYKTGMASILNNLGTIYYDRGDLQLALGIYMQAKNILVEMDDKYRTAQIQGNVGMVFADIGDHGRAIEEYNSSLKIFEELKDKKGIADTYNLIGVIYNNWGEYDLGVEYFNNSLKIYQELEGNYSNRIAVEFHNLGTSYSYLNKNDTALFYFEKCIGIRKEMDDQEGLASTYHNIGTIYEAKNELDSALYFLDNHHAATTAKGCTEDPIMISGFGKLRTTLNIFVK